MTIKLGVVMDPIESITPYKDTTLAMLLAAQKNGWQIYYMQQNDLFLRDGFVQAHMQQLTVFDDNHHWYETHATSTQQVSECDVLLMRKDPPFNMEYIYTTYLLELVEKSGTFVVNNPKSLRDTNEKLFTTWFPGLCPNTLVTCNTSLIKAFLADEKDIIVKPLDGMAGKSIFRIQKNDPNTSAILEVITKYGSETVMAQTYLPAIAEGDKRIILIDGKPVPYALARIPAAGESRANLAAGGRGIAQPLSKRDYEICEKVGKILRDKGLLFVGLDVIGDYLTEINVTSPTCAREIDAKYNTNIGAEFIQCLANYLDRPYAGCA